VVAIHAGLLFAFLNLAGTINVVDPQRVMRVFDVLDPALPPPPPPPPPPVQQQKPKPKEKDGGSAPKNIKSEATPVVAPKPRVVIPVKPTVAVSETPRQGTAPTQGASDVRGTGTGAGGTGTGTGSGGSGTGSGAGGDGGIASGPRIISPTLTSRDYPRPLARGWPRGGRVFVAFRVQVNGTATNCRIDRSSGNPAIDAETCRLVQSRLRFRPAMNRRGEPVVAWYGYIQAEVGR
jgi:protein TonB